MIDDSPSAARGGAEANRPERALASESPPVIDDAWTPRRVVAATLVVATVCLAFFLLLYFHTVLFCFFSGIVVAIALAPLIARVVKLGLSPSMAVPLTYLTLAVVVGLGLAVGAPLLVEQSATLIEKLPDTYQELRNQLTDTPSDTFNRLTSYLPSQLPSFESIPGLLPDSIAPQTATLGEVIVRGLFWFTAAMLVAFYWSLQGQRTLAAIMLTVPETNRNVVRELVDTMQERVGAFVRGQGSLCLMVGALSLVAYLVIGLPYAFALAAIAGILELVPYFGPTLGTLPALGVAAAYDPSLILWVLVAAAIVQFLENNFLVPRIMDRSVGVHPVVTLLAIVAFGSIYGGVGVVLAVPLAALLQVTFERLVLREGTEPPKPPVGRDRSSRLRYEVQELVQDVQQRVRAKTDPATSGEDHIEDSIEAIATDLERALAAVDEGRATSDDLEGQI